MKIHKQLRKIVDEATRASFKEGRLLEKEVLKFVKIFKQLGAVEAIAALSYYLKGIKRVVGQYTMVVESTEKLTSGQMQQIENSLNTRYIIHNTIYRLNSSLLGGIKVRIGDSIFEDSIRSKIKQVKEAIN